MLEYQPAGDSLLIFVARRDGVRAIAVALPRGGLSSRVRLARELIAIRHDSLGPALPVLRGLGDLLIGSARRAGALSGVRDLAIVPHGVLAYLPFAALADSDRPVAGAGLHAADAALRRVARRAPGQIAVRSRRPGPRCSPRIRIACRRPPRRPRRSRGRCPGRRSSWAATRASGRRARRCLGGGGASRGPRRAQPAEPDVLLDRRRRSGPARGGRPARGARDPGPPGPESAGLSLGMRDGARHRREHRVRPGEDFATLARAFLYAGARNVVATLWRVDDAGAAAFATEYYGRLGAEGPAGALAGAQRAMAAGGRWAAPYYWAGYTLAGDGRSVKDIGTAVGWSH